MLYEKVLRPILFLIDPETIHGLVIHGLKYASSIGVVKNIIERFLSVDDPVLMTKLGSLELKNPVGLAAGFDKYIVAPKAYSMVGFGFAELGSITNTKLAGNPRPRLWRIPEDKGLIVYYGLANGGSDYTVKKMTKLKKHDIPLGINIAPTTGLDIKDMADDYIQTLLKLNRYADYITLNVSCPNVASCDKFAQVSFILELIEKARCVLDEHKIQKDIYIKIGQEFKNEELDQIVDSCISNKITGIIATNLIKNRAAVIFKSSAKKLNHSGGISGKLLGENGNKVIKYIRSRAGDKLIIIGLGGIFTAEDAYEKIKCGANALQIMTGWIYGGPFTIRKINKGLIKLLQADGFDKLEQAVGTNK